LGWEVSLSSHIVCKYWHSTPNLMPSYVPTKWIRWKKTLSQYPITHLKSYCNKIAEVVHDEKLLMHFFQDNLSGAALSWYMRLDNTKIRKWKNLVDAFVKQYKYNMDITPDRTSLSNLEKRDKESIREMERSSCSGASPAFGQRDGHSICQHV